MKGFTLIELVVVIVLLAIVSIFTFRFVGLGSEMYVTGAERLKLLDQSRFTIERITRELRNSVPNSARVRSLADGSECLEFVPIKVAGTYYNAPFNDSAAATLELVTMSTSWSQISAQAPNNDRLFIYATQPKYVYNEDVAGERRWALADTNQTRSGQQTTITLESNYFFAEQSPRQRLYVGSSPVSFCVDTAGTIRRFSDYGWNQTPSSSDNVAIGERIINLTAEGSQPPFEVENATLLRNNVIHIFLEYETAAAERLFFNQEVHIPNAP
ncbi:prepilin-type N-terminal cleavage/methylation domain-containing protein [Idiomarina seosinensis]|uniref:Pilus assembly protein n=1 Tax=Idiomarina seosinensis TaxID=281739 RepID=A0A432ZDA7_9GAMM|nr:prepilin-type N-terminal cleavage/methylation domain-containing protein [Idiomarina seosinensis]RUO75937.1 pilus assembly protein [Idiomarina seosinensis]